MSSFSGEVGIPSRVPYCSSKFAVTGFFEALRAELDDFNVAITIICPPSVATPMRNNDLLNKENEKHD
jgi:short-subunit dehydrogenase